MLDAAHAQKAAQLEMNDQARSELFNEINCSVKTRARPNYLLGLSRR